MSAYILVTGELDKIKEFELKVSSALEEGYELAGELRVNQIQSQTSQSTLLLQSMVFDSYELDDDDFSMMSEEEVRSLVENIISEVGASQMSDFGKVMPQVMKKGAGKVDGNVAQSIVKELLS